MAPVVGLALAMGWAMAFGASAPADDAKARAVQHAEWRLGDWARRLADLKNERAALASDSEPYRALDAHIGRLEEDLAVVEAITKRLREAGESESLAVARRLDGRFAVLEATAARRPGVR